MKITLQLLVLSAASIVSATSRNAKHNAYVRRRDEVLGRQLPAAASVSSVSSVSSSSSVSSASGPAVTPSVTVSTTGSSVSGLLPSTTLTVSTSMATTPTVDGSTIPALNQITMDAPVETPLTMFTTFLAGATAPYSGAPALPTAANILGSNYPLLDAVPDVTSPQVQQWLSEIDLSNVPNLQLTVDGSCASDPALAQNQSRCWWTCGGCTRPTDIVDCPDKLDWGVSYDDGPSPYTPKLVNFLHQNNITATFFVVGSRVVSRPAMLQTEYMLGHEISDHTWSHHPLTTLTNEQIVAELGWTRQAIKDVIGVSPVTMRPPYGDIDDRVRAVCKAMGLTPVIWTGSGSDQFDTDDWKIASGASNGTYSYAAWQKIISTASTLSTGFISLQHDLYQQSVDLAVGYILPEALTYVPTFKLQSVIECLHKAPSLSYAELGGGNLTTNGTSGGSTSGSPTVGGKGAAAATMSFSALVGLACVTVALGTLVVW